MFRVFFFFQAEDGIRDGRVTGVQTCALPISPARSGARGAWVAAAGEAGVVGDLVVRAWPARAGRTKVGCGRCGVVSGAALRLGSSGVRVLPPAGGTGPAAADHNGQPGGGEEDDRTADHDRAARARRPRREV